MPAASLPEATEIIFFLDRSVDCKVITTALESAGARIELHRRHFEPAALDVDWLPEVGKRGWIVLTKDSKIRYRALELQALRSAAVGAFVLVPGNLTGKEMADVFVKALPAMRRVINDTPRPFLAKIYRDSSVKRVDW